MRCISANVTTSAAACPRRWNSGAGARRTISRCSSSSSTTKSGYGCLQHRNVVVGGGGREKREERAKLSVVRASGSSSPPSSSSSKVVAGGVDQSLNPRVANLNESKTVALTDLARTLKERGEDVIGLAAGEPDFDTP